jgi:antitoxin component YwqK of YwqJK toxin-antitoxin module
MGNYKENGFLMINGNKTAMATYDNGQKSGKWFFWNDTVLSEVDYSNNQIASVKNGSMML